MFSRRLQDSADQDASRVRKRRFKRLGVERLEDRRLLALDPARLPYDIDGNGTADPLSDGILVIRYLAGFTGDALTQGVVDPAGDRRDEAAIMARLAAIQNDFFDPDGDVNNLPLSDGILIIRHLAGFNDNALVTGAVNLQQGIRRSAATIQRYLDLPINKPPQGTAGPYGLNEDGPLAVSASNGLLENVFDPDGDTLTARLGVPAGNGSVAVQPDGSFTYVPNPDFFGVDSFTFVASDAFGAETDLLIQIDVASVNDPPIVAEPTFETANDSLLQVTSEQGLFRSVSDTDDDALSVVLLANAQHGVVTLDEDGGFRYQPVPGFVGDDSFRFGITDGQSPIVEAEARIHVFATNTKPIARNLEYFVDEDGVLTVGTSDGIAVKGGFDADGDSLQIRRSGPDHGKFDYSLDGSFTYVPNHNFHGQDFVTYAVRDDDGNESNEATVTFTVRPVFDPPALFADVRDTAVNTRLQLDGERGVLSNDVLLPDLDANTAIMSVTVPPAHGTIVESLDGNNQPAIFYVPNPEFIGTDTFEYGISVGQTVHGSATVSILVAPRDQTLYENATKTLRIFGRDAADHVQLNPVGTTPDDEIGITFREPANGGSPYREETFQMADLQVIEFYGFGGDDFLETNLQEISFITIRAFGGDGNDLLQGLSGDDYLEGNAGFDQLFGGGGNDVLYGNHPATGVPVSVDLSGDLLVGGDGNDTLHGSDGVDDVYGGNGNDQLFGYAESDNLSGDRSFDANTGVATVGNLPGDDRLDGGDGEDFLEGGRGINHLNGGRGADWYHFFRDLELAGSRHVLEDQVSSPDGFTTDENTLVFTNFNDPANLSFGAPVVYDMNKKENRVFLPAAPAENNELVILINDVENFKSLIGGSANDIIAGNTGRVNSIDGQLGDDLLYGGDVRDTLRGGSGKDTLFGGGGDDVLDGGVGENRADNIAFGGAGTNTIVNATDPTKRIHVTTFLNTPTQFGSKFISVKINGTDSPDLLTLTASGTTLTFSLITVIDKDAGRFETETEAVNFADAYIDWKFIGGRGNDEYRDNSNLRSINPRFAAFGGTIYGGEGDDLLVGSDGLDYLVGGPGNDTLEGRGGNDTLVGGGPDLDANAVDDDTYVFSGFPQDIGVDLISEPVPDGMRPTLGGFDTLDFRLLESGVTVDLRQPFRNTLFQFAGTDSGLERVQGTRFADDISGTERNDVLEGNDGNDKINGHAGDDIVRGGRGADVLIGGLGTDTIFGDDDNDFIFACFLNDFEPSDISRDELHGGGGDDVIHGSAGRNEIFGDDGEDRLFGHAGNDAIHGGRDNDKLQGGDGSDSLRGGDGRDELTGDAGKDTLRGEEGVDILHGGEDEDLLFGGTGDDQLFGGDAGDELQGGDGDDRLFGESGNDLLVGDSGQDFIFGGAGDDEIQGGGDGDRLYGGRGRDIIFGEDGDDSIDGGSGNDLLIGGDGNDKLLAGEGDDEAQGGRGDDRIAGGNGTDKLFGEAGNDLLMGQAGNDYVDGGFGIDALLGGSNIDILFGGADGDFLGLDKEDRKPLEDALDARIQVDVGQHKDIDLPPDPNIGGGFSLSGPGDYFKGVTFGSVIEAVGDVTGAFDAEYQDSDNWKFRVCVVVCGGYGEADGESIVIIGGQIPPNPYIPVPITLTVEFTPKRDPSRVAVDLDVGPVSINHDFVNKETEVGIELPTGSKDVGASLSIKVDWDNPDGEELEEVSFNYSVFGAGADFGFDSSSLTSTDEPDASNNL